MIEFSEKDMDVVITVLNTFQNNYLHLDVPTLKLRELFTFLDTTQQNIILDISKDIRKTENIQKHALAGSELIIPARDAYAQKFVRVSAQADAAFMLMNDAIYQATGQRIAIISGYRSAAYQAMVLLRELHQANFSLMLAERVAKQPLYSEHCRFPYHAIDVLISSTGHSKEISTDFEKSSAYAWMVENAPTYGFSLSYSPHNSKNTIFEPWHWLFKGFNIQH